MQHYFSQIGHFLASVVDSIPGVYQPQSDLEIEIADKSLDVVLVSAIILVVLVIIGTIIRGRVEKLKMPVFVMMAATMIGSTLWLIGSTVYLNTHSESGGPIHWHADFEIWACGNQLELRDPTGFLSNKIGTSVLHEHDDQRIHLEGVAVEKENDASLGKFFNVIGGAITNEAMVVPLNEDPSLTFEDEVDGDGANTTNPQFIDPYIIQDGLNGRVAYFQDGQTCGQETAEVQVFVYRYNGEDKTYEQRKIDNPKDFVIFEDSNVPPGDCIIFEFDVPKEKTDKLCEQYGIRDINLCSVFGVDEAKREICELTQVNYDPDIDYRILPEIETETELEPVETDDQESESSEETEQTEELEDSDA